MNIAPGEITVGYLEAECLVNRMHPNPELARQRLASIMKQRLAQACGTFLAAALDPADPSVWVVKDIHLDLALDLTGSDEDQSARVFARRVAERLTDAIAAGPDGQNALRFENRAAYLSQFLADLAQGIAWSQWYYDLFEPLQSLPAGTAAREALARDPELAAPVMLDLQKNHRIEQLLRLWSHADAQLVLGFCERSSRKETGGPEARRLLDALVSLWPAVPLRETPEGLATPHNALRLWLSLRRSSPDLAGEGSAGAIEMFLRWLESAGKPHGERPPEVEAWLLEASGGDIAWMRGLAAKVGEARETEATIACKSWSTPCGGAFLLLPGALEIGLDDWIRAAPYAEPEGCSKAALLRLLVLAKCLGGSAARERLSDPVLKLVAGCARTPGWDAVVRYSEAAARVSWLDSLPAAAERDATFLHVPGLMDEFDQTWSRVAAAVSWRLARRLYGFDRSSAAHLADRFLGTDCIVTVSDECIEAHLERCELDIVLRMAGLDGMEYRLPWLDPGLVRIRLAGP